MKKYLTLILLMNLLTQSNVGKTQDLESFKQFIIPESGLWWNPQQSGTGASMQFSKNGTWFIALYLYSPNGTPVFFTMQGDEIEYSLDRSVLENEAYARISSTLTSNTSGRCLGCEYTTPTPFGIDVSAEIIFFQKGEARIKYTINDNDPNTPDFFEEHLTTNFLPNDEFSEDYIENRKIIHFFGNGFNKSYLVSEQETLSNEFSMNLIYECLNCEAQENTTELNYENITLIKGFENGGTINQVTIDIDDNSHVNYSFVTGKKGVYANIDEVTAIQKGIPSHVIIQSIY